MGVFGKYSKDNVIKGLSQAKPDLNGLIWHRNENPWQGRRLVAKWLKIIPGDKLQTGND